MKINYHHFDNDNLTFRDNDRLRDLSDFSADGTKVRVSPFACDEEYLGAVYKVQSGQIGEVFWEGFSKKDAVAMIYNNYMPRKDCVNIGLTQAVRVKFEEDGWNHVTYLSIYDLELV